MSAALPYIVRQRTLADLAAEIGTSARYLGQRARKMGIPIRTWAGTPSVRNRRFELHHLRSAQAMLAATEHEWVMSGSMGYPEPLHRWLARQDERVTESEADLLVLLRQLDDPEWLEWPEQYNRGEAAAHFSGLVTRLEGDFAARCTAEQDTQDSSEYGRVVVPADATVCGTRIVVCVSKFGSLALVCADNPGAFFGTEDAQAEGELDGADLGKVNRALVELGYVVAAEELLESDYDGPSQLPRRLQRPTWWDRFFGFF